MIILNNCNKIYENTNKEALKTFNVKLPNNGIIAICGESGSGKSTFMNCLCGLDDFTNGEIYIGDKKVKNLYKYSNFVFQEFKLIEELSVYKNLSIINDDEKIITDILERFKISEYINTKVSMLSGGQRARIGIARTLISKSNVIVLDEPIANLDIETSKIILDILKDSSKEKLILISSHQKDLLLEYASDVINIENGIVNHNDRIDDDKCDNYEEVKENKIKGKDKFKLALVNVKGNMLKTIMSFVFILISLAILFIMFSFILIDKPLFMYKTYKNNNMEYVTFEYYDNNITKSVPNSIINELNPDVIIYNQTFIAYDEANNEQLFDLVEVSKDIDSNKIVVYGDKSIEFLKYNGTTFSVDFLKSTDSKIVVNKDNYFKIKANLYNNFDIRIKKNKRSKTYEVYSPFNSYSDSLIDGTMPSKENEIAVSKMLAKEYFDDIDNIIGEEISLDLCSGNNGIYNNGLVVETKKFIISGICTELVHFSDDVVDDILFNYGVNSLNNADKKIKYNSYTMNTFAECINNKLIPSDNIGIDAIGTYNAINNFKFVFWIGIIIFILILGFTIFNMVNSSIIKSKKTIGILTSYKIKRNSCIGIYINELLLIIIPSLILSIVLYFISIPIINNIISTGNNYNFYVLNYNIFVFLILLFCLILISLLAVIIPFSRLKKKSIVDILYER